MNQLVKSVEDTLGSLSNIKNVIVAYSGGVDSHVLIHVCSILQKEHPSLDFLSVYIDHGIHEDSCRWREHCERVSQTLGVPFKSTIVNGNDLNGDGPEQAARHARYDALASYVDASTVLLTAQHQDDQAETFMLQLLRGSGLKGLASMPKVSDFAGGLIARPFLEFDKQAVLDYAHINKLVWIEDPSNLDESLNRNFLRQQVIPLLKQRWPSFSGTTSRSAQHCAEASDLLSAMASSHLPDSNVDVLPFSSISSLSDELQRAVLREWLSLAAKRLPSKKVLERIQSFIDLGAESSALVEWGDCQVRTFCGHFVLLNKGVDYSRYGAFEWSSEEQALPEGLGSLTLKKSVGRGVKQALWNQSQVSIRSRSGGELIKLLGRDGRKQLKKLYYESKVFPWVRDVIPLVYLGDELVAVADMWLAESYLADSNEAGLEIVWQRPNLKIKF